MNYELLSGETIELNVPNAMTAAFIDRVRSAACDPGTTVVQVEALVYGPENPLLATMVIPGRAVVTAATYADPAFHLMLDMIGRKRAVTGHLDLHAARARHTMTVADTAQQLAITESAVRQAIHAGRLSAWKDGGTYYLDPVVVGAFRVARRGHKPNRPLFVRCGSNAGSTLSVKASTEITNSTRQGNIVIGQFDGWSKIAVLASCGPKARFFILEPSSNENSFEFDGLFVRGRFDIVTKDNNAKRARESFKQFTPE